MTSDGVLITSGETVEVPLTCESSKQLHGLTGRLWPVHPPRFRMGVRWTVVPYRGSSGGKDLPRHERAADDHDITRSTCIIRTRKHLHHLPQRSLIPRHLLRNDLHSFTVCQTDISPPAANSEANTAHSSFPALVLPILSLRCRSILQQLLCACSPGQPPCHPPLDPRSGRGNPHPHPRADHTLRDRQQAIRRRACRTFYRLPT
jgi:hypothetical protein